MKNPKIKLKYENFLREYNVYLLNGEEKWNSDLEKVKLYINKNNIIPSTTSENIEIKKLAKWLGTQKITYKDNTCIMKNTEIRLKYEEFLNEYREYFLSYEEKWNINLEKMKLYINKHNKRHSSTSNIIEVRKIGSWFDYQYYSYKNNNLYTKNPEIKLKYEEFLNEYREYFLRKGKIIYK